MLNSNENYGVVLTEGFNALAFEEDGFANDPFNGISNYERLDTIHTEIPALRMGSDPFVDLLDMIDSIDISHIVGMKAQSQDPEDEQESNSNPYIPDYAPLPEMEVPDIHIPETEVPEISED